MRDPDNEGLPRRSDPTEAIGPTDPATERSPATDPDDVDGAGEWPAHAGGPGGADQLMDPPSPGRSVFADPVSPDDHAVSTAVSPHRGSRPVLDGAMFGVYEDDRPTSRLPAVIATLLILLALGVGFLVWRAVNTDAELAVPGDVPPPTSPVSVVPTTPTVEAAQALVPDTVSSCRAPAAQPDDAPARVILQCPLDGVPEALALVLYESIESRDDAFDAIVDQLDVPTSGAECSLGRFGVHDYIGVRRVGRVACQAMGGRVDFVWTSEQAPVLLRSGGGGDFADHHEFWSTLVERTDGAFPLPDEQALLDRLPDGLRNGCRRDLGLVVDAAGTVAVRCAPTDDAVDVVSSVQFTDIDSMTAWIDARSDSLRTNVFDETDDACTSAGFGQRSVLGPPGSPAPPATPSPPAAAQDPEAGESTAPTAGEPPPPAPDAGFTTYEVDGRTGEILCFVNSSGLNALFWIRDDTLIGSIAVSDRNAGKSMTQLLAWFEAGGHRP